MGGTGWIPTTERRFVGRTVMCPHLNVCYTVRQTSNNSMIETLNDSDFDMVIEVVCRPLVIA
jgi:hypothetical protein